MFCVIVCAKVQMISEISKEYLAIVYSGDAASRRPWARLGNRALPRRGKMRGVLQYPTLRFCIER